MRADSNYQAIARTAASLWSDTQRNTASTIIVNNTSLLVAQLQALPDVDLLHTLSMRTAES